MPPRERATVPRMRSYVAPLFVLAAGCGSKMPLPRDLAANAMELSVSGPPTSLTAGPFGVRAFRDVSEQEATSVLGPAKTPPDRLFAFELAQGGAPLRKVACRAWKRPATGSASDDGGMTCAIGTAGGNTFGQLTMTDGARGTMRLGIDAYVVAPEGEGTGVKQGTRSVAVWQYGAPRTAWLPSDSSQEIQANMVSVMAAMVVYRELIAAR